MNLLLCFTLRSFLSSLGQWSGRKQYCRSWSANKTKIGERTGGKGEICFFLPLKDDGFWPLTSPFFFFFSAAKLQIVELDPPSSLPNGFVRTAILIWKLNSPTLCTGVCIRGKGLWDKPSLCLGWFVTYSNPCKICLSKGCFCGMDKLFLIKLHAFLKPALIQLTGKCHSEVLAIGIGCVAALIKMLIFYG